MASDTSDNGPRLAAAVLALLPLTVITLALRCYVRVRILKFFKAEDWLAIATMICFIIYCTLVMISISHGAGKTISQVPLQNYPTILKMRYAGEIVYIMTSLLIKFTVGIFLLRICSLAWQRTAIWTALFVCLVYSVFFTFMAIFQCRPVPYYWSQYTEQMTGTCFSDELVRAISYAHAVINCVCDWTLGLLPIALIGKLELSKRSKIMVSCTLALGSIASIATIIRIPYIWQLAAENADRLHVFTVVSIWSTVENGLGLIASSLATLRPLYRKIFGTAGSRARTPSAKRRSFYSWRKSGSVNVNHMRGDGNIEYYRMDRMGKYPNRSASGKDSQENFGGVYDGYNGREYGRDYGKELGKIPERMPERVRVRDPRDEFDSAYP
ncbi:uncharacterized protein GGS22DRAFT_186236 [Annulohypoxylon maeteangense]|uniref:uncharacterized protein n=1 Tax=Annulohypoxylon maeteangense TaxID=1927788 RepID=UPI00200792E9|nr:uncharacterized protein GGS22DRAFT_186236 [Annulohypoxylon maeteangense]KAI0887404.1 hypothetical protein GGS22DRAFT_186236 [Annulohypoxylon maeteangense]